MTTWSKKARQNSDLYLSDIDRSDLDAYIQEGGRQLPLATARSFFELFLTGSSVDEIHKLNPSYPKAAINWCRVQFDWDECFHNTVMSLQNRIQAKVIKAQIEAASLYADVISVANKKHGYALKKYLQTGDESLLVGTIAVKSVSQLAAAINGLNSLLTQEQMQKLGRANPPRGRSNSDDNSGAIDVESRESVSPLQKVAQKKREEDKS